MTDIPARKRILIAGAGSGFGRGAALQLAELGHDVVAATLDAAQAESLRVENPDIDAIKLDPGPYASGFNDAMVDGVDDQLGSGGGAVELELAAGTRTRMPGNQRDPNEVVETMVDLRTADEVPFETFKPDDILERYGIAR